MYEVVEFFRRGQFKIEDYHYNLLKVSLFESKLQPGALFVCGFSHSASEYEVRSVFNNYGDTSGIAFFTRKFNGKDIHFAKIDFKNRVQAMEAKDKVNEKGIYKVREWGVKEENTGGEDEGLIEEEVIATENYI